MAKTLTQPDNTTQSGSVYKAAIDDSVAVLAEIGQDFAPHQSTVADLNVLIDAGKGIKADGTLVQQSQQSIAFTAPVTNPRIDRIVIDMLTLVASRIAGTEAASPTAPAITAGKLPCAQVSLSVGQTQITNINITDERTAFVQYKTHKTEGSAQNSGSVVVLDTGTVICTLDLGTVSLSDRILVTATINSTKGASAGMTEFFIQKSSGTAVVAAFNSRTYIRQAAYELAGVTNERVISGILKVTTAGTLVLEFKGYSEPGSITISAGNGQIHAIVLAG